MFTLTYGFNTGEIYTDATAFSNDIDAIWQVVLNYKKARGYDFRDKQDAQELYNELVQWVVASKDVNNYMEANFRIELWRNANLSNESFETAIIIGHTLDCIRVPKLDWSKESDNFYEAFIRDYTLYTASHIICNYLAGRDVYTSHLNYTMGIDENLIISLECTGSSDILSDDDISLELLSDVARACAEINIQLANHYLDGITFEQYKEIARLLADFNIYEISNTLKQLFLTFGEEDLSSYLKVQGSSTFIQVIQCSTGQQVALFDITRFLSIPNMEDKVSLIQIIVRWLVCD